MCLEVKVGSPLFHTLSIKVNVEFCSFFRCLLDVLWNLTGLHFLMILLLHLLQDITKKKTKTDIRNILNKALLLSCTQGDVDLQNTLWLFSVALSPAG